MAKVRLTIGNKEYPCRVTMGAMLQYERETGKDVQKMDGNSITELITFIWCCVISACRADGVEFSLSLDEFADRIDAQSVKEFYSSLDQQKKSVEVAG